jgi:hypothetical protein
MIVSPTVHAAARAAGRAAMSKMSRKKANSNAMFPHHLSQWDRNFCA